MATAERANEVRRNPDDYSGPEKAAIVMLSLGDHANPLMSLLDEEEIRQVSQMMSNLGVVPQGVVEAVVTEFFDRFSTVGTLMGSYEQTRRMLTGIMEKDRVDALMEELHGPAGRSVWEKLANVNEEILANFLQKEYPQTVAVVMSKITTDHAGKVLALLPESFAMEVIHRMLRMEAVQKEVLEDVEKTLRQEFMSNLARTQRRDSHEHMAEIFNNLDRAAEAKFMDALEKTVPESAEKIRSLMFTFEDLQKITPAGIQAIIRASDKDKLPPALKGATETLRDLFFSNMSERAAKIMREDMAAMGPVRLKDVEEAQLHIVSVAKDLEARGEITIASGNEEDELIY